MKGNLRTAPLMQNIHYFMKWTVISLVIGSVVGLIGTFFGHCVLWAAELWKVRPWMLYLAPVSGVIIALLYRICQEEGSRGTT